MLEKQQNWYFSKFQLLYRANPRGADKKGRETRCQGVKDKWGLGAGMPLAGQAPDGYRNFSRGGGDGGHDGGDAYGS